MIQNEIWGQATIINSQNCWDSENAIPNELLDIIVKL